MHSLPIGRTVPEVTHHKANVNGIDLHYVSAGSSGSPILLVHGFPETWWTFHKLIGQLAVKHRVFAVDLRGFGDSHNGEGNYDSKTLAEDIRQLIVELDVGPVHLTGQDISGAVVFRLAAAHPELVRSLTAIEMGLAGFGLEALADTTHGGSWHIGMLAAPDIPELLLTGREREYLGKVAFPSLCAVPGAFSDGDIDEFVRSYARPNGWRGAIGLYRSMLEEGDELKKLVDTNRLTVPVLAVDAGGGPFTSSTMAQVAGVHFRFAVIEGVGHYVAMEAPTLLADEMLRFFGTID